MGLRVLLNGICNIMKDKLCLVTGGFDPLHSGHIEYFKAAKELSNYLVIAVNSDKWLIKKKNYFFMPWSERSEIIKSLSFVDEVIAFDDSDGSACDAIKICLTKAEKVLFANGGDRKKNNIPEADSFLNNPNVEFIYGIGGAHKINSSSNLTSNFYNNFSKILNSEKGNIEHNDISSPWGFHNLIVNNESYKVKILSVNPYSQLSLQKHQHREEHWIIIKGKGEVTIDGNTIHLATGDYIHIPKLSEHSLKNTSTENMVVLEVQLGEILEEADIQRISDIYGRDVENS